MRLKVLGFSTLIAFVMAGCGEQQQAATQAAPAPEVGVQVIKPENLTFTERYAGKTATLEKVSVVAEVSGVITKVHVKEGQHVERDQLLFEIDASPFEAEVLRQKALMKQAEANLALAQVKYDMSKSLQDSNAMSKIDAEQVKVNREVAAAALASANASLVSAELALKKAKVLAPIAGNTGIMTYSVGDLVGPAQGPVVDIVGTGEIEVYSQIGEKEHFEHVSELLRDKQRVPDTLELELADGTMYEHTGVINFKGREVKDGTVTYRVVFPNPDGLILGGQNVTIVATAGKQSTVHYVPQKAVMEDQLGRFVYVVGEDNVVEKRVVDMGNRYGMNWVVKDGLQDGEKVIVSGILKAKVGQAVSPVEE
ncbi:efflux RND transporter periplasmic adaptor subunit [Thalassotalea sp. HSM 43]|uniref:efflux RND transporter periplasmic adaptor subunit n=1 Tax=Thalassotalea sp. HSM 43 TaxID=2552945 RepID=UPI001081F3DB|nr:efflux RND transporter periplasmic adaptor subunit [Thalassotalea sp. HSM 43]QBY03955.1 efflux RND transporter periplasmic adaptor subunit [Thalassotalea sp. HSM 43]